jgi:hypothetical protein
MVGTRFRRNSAAARQRGGKAEDQEFAAVDQQQLRSRRPHAAHHRAAIKMPPHVAFGGQRHGHGGEDYRQQGGEAQEALCPLGDVADFGPRVVQAFDLFAAPELRVGPGLICLYVGSLAGQVQAVANAAAVLDQAGCRQVGQVDHQPRRQGEHVHAAIGLHGQDGAASHRDPAQRQRCAGREAQRGCQALVGPGLAGLRHDGGGCICGVQHGRRAQAAAQRIARRDRLDFGQQGGIAQADHAREGGALGHAQTAGRRLLAEEIRQRMIGGQQQVAAEQLMGLLAQRLLDAVGEEADAGQCRHGQHQADAEHGELAGAPVAREHAHCQPKRNHKNLLATEAAENMETAESTRFSRRPLCRRREPPVLPFTSFASARWPARRGPARSLRCP